MQKEWHKIIIDTNLWISFLISNQIQFVSELVLARHLIFSDELLSEILNVVWRPKLQKLFSEENIKVLFEIINDYAEFIEVSSEINICRDKKDNYLLALAKDSQADFLITGDDDLLSLKEFEGTKIIKIADYKTLIQESNSETQDK